MKAVFGEEKAEEISPIAVGDRVVVYDPHPIKKEAEPVHGKEGIFASIENSSVVVVLIEKGNGWKPLRRAAKQAEQYVLSPLMASEGGEGANASVLPPAASAGQSLWGGYLEMIAQHQMGELDGDTEGVQGSQANGSG
uniref:Uncharacterized protein n=1 Tax=Chromera velia CCMP2878 TaxID=1169474 RepID=A0A0G4I587_9ALVE|eukprot:Cvel_36042.t1-p1 / transcript=Cvel_36042.t1 / gene=Cvel_36042 / organism=Chromera_velia_CCMP2878 / gene_product=hypothetical protein / transcript_product=hypothetical protein / location=Cvel_scaffold6891:1607-2242(-) / protein_length=137 / sequence_SO=supercontig / SO=protein_coding / is_pseudo=false